MSGEITPEQVRQVLDLELGPNDSGQPTVRGYLIALLRGVWTEAENFSGKRPFGNSGWDSDFAPAMVRAGIIEGTLDEDGYLEDLSRDGEHRLNELVLAAIESLGAPPPEQAATEAT